MKNVFILGMIAWSAIAQDTVPPVPPAPPVPPMPPMVRARTIGFKDGFAFARPGKGEDQTYERGQRNLDAHRWDEALKNFSDVAASAGARSDGALYWKAYVQNRLGQRPDALATLDQLRKTYPNSRWLDDAKALEAEVRQAQGQPVKPESEDDEALKLLAINSLLNSDPERAIPLLEKLLQSGQAPKLKGRALFVLTQSSSPKAREVVVRVAKGGSNPDLQIKAVSYIGQMKDRKTLSEIYSASPDAAVKRAVLRAFGSIGADQELLQAAKSEKDVELRREAVRQLSGLGAQGMLADLYPMIDDLKIKAEIMHSLAAAGTPEQIASMVKAETDIRLKLEGARGLSSMDSKRASEALMALYSSESDKQLRMEIVNGLAAHGNAKALVELARKEKDPELKRQIVERLSSMRSKEAADYLMDLLK